MLHHPTAPEASRQKDPPRSHLGYAWKTPLDGGWPVKKWDNVIGFSIPRAQIKHFMHLRWRF